MNKIIEKNLVRNENPLAFFLFYCWIHAFWANVVPSATESEYIVEKILDEKIEINEKGERVRRYLVQWHGFDIAQSTWEPMANLVHALGVLDDWKEEKQQRKFREVIFFLIKLIVFFLKEEKIFATDYLIFK